MAKLWPNDPFVQAVVRTVAHEPLEGVEDFRHLQEAFTPLEREKFDPLCPLCGRPTIKVVSNGYWFRAEPKQAAVGLHGYRVWQPHDRVCLGRPAGVEAAAAGGDAR